MSDAGVATHSVCTKMGLPIAAYERTIGPANRRFHELAETVVLHKEGVLPLDPDDDTGGGVPEHGSVDATDGDGVPTFDDVQTHGRQ